MIEKLDELVTWFYDECYITEVDTLEAIYDCYARLVEKIHCDNIVTETDDVLLCDLEEPVDSAVIDEEYRCFIEMPIVNEAYILVMSYIKIDGKYSADLEYVEAINDKFADNFNDDED